MRILVSTGIFPNATVPTRGIYIFKQVEALVRRCEVGVVAPVAFYPPGAGNRTAPVPSQSLIDGVRILHPRYPIVPGLRFLHGPSVAWATWRCHRRVCEALRPDVILSFFAYPYGYAATRIGRRLGIPVIIGTLGSDVNVKATRRFERPMIAWAFHNAARVISVSRALDRRVGELGVPGERRAVIPNGVDATRFRPLDMAGARARLGLPEGVRLVGCVSRLSREKGIDVLLNAFARCARAGDAGPHLFVVGDGVEEASLQRLAGDLGIAERVTFAGVRPHAEVPHWIAAADVVVLPSRIEGHPNAVVEAMACGRPVVATRVGGVPDAIPDERLGLLVESEDAGGLARAIDVAFSREWDTDAIAAAGGRRTWDHVASEIIDIVAGLGREAA